MMISALLAIVLLGGGAAPGGYYSTGDYSTTGSYYTPQAYDLPDDLGPEENETVHLTPRVEPGAAIEIHNLNGPVAVSSWNGSYVDIVAVKRTHYGREELDKATVTASDDDPLIVATNHTDRDVRVSVDYEIRTPYNTSIDIIESTNGPITAENVTVTRAKTTNGMIGLIAIAGNVTAATSNAGISLKDINGTVSAGTSNGPVTAENVSRVAELVTSNGGIIADLTAVEDLTTVSTSNAGIRLALSEDLDADIVAETRNGRITVRDIPLRISGSSATSLSGTLGGGGPTITVTTSNGNIDLSGL